MFVALMQVAVADDDSQDRSVDCIRERAGRIALPRSVSGAVGGDDATHQIDGCMLPDNLATRHAMSLLAKYCSDDIRKVEFHSGMPLRLLAYFHNPYGPDVNFQSFTVPSSLPVAYSLPSGEKLDDQIGP